MKQFILNYKKQILLIIVLIILLSSGIIVKAISTKDSEIINPNSNFHEQIKVKVDGEVKYPNTYYVETGSTIKDVIFLASGLTKYSDTSFINLNKEVKDEEIIFISKKDTITKKRINVNIASINELKSLSDIGETLAYNIVVYRSIHGPFNTLYDMLKVSGMTIKIISKNINEICLS